MKNILNRITLVVLLVSTLISCVDEDKFVNPVHFQLENGAFIKFANHPSPVVSLEDPATAAFSEEIIDANGNTDVYTLQMTAHTNNTTIVVDDFKIINSFPTTLTITAQEIADAAGINLSDITYGDSFDFVATALRNDGVLYNDVNTETTLNSQPGYKSAMKFKFIFGCPGEVSQEDLVGMWQITSDDFGIVENNGVVEIIAGPGENQVTLLDIFGHVHPDTGEQFDVVMDYSPSSSSATISTQESWDSGAYGLTYGIGRNGGEGLIFNCVGSNGFMSFQLEHTVSTGETFGTHAMEFTKL